MKLMGIEFAPLNIPFERRLQTLAAASWFFLFPFGGPVSLILSIYVLFCTRFWWLVLGYFGWMILDRHTPEKGGRPVHSVADWTWWSHFRDYFPMKLVCVDDFKLDPNRNYLFCSFPHGMLSAGAFHAFLNNASGRLTHFPHHNLRFATLSQHFTMPFFRELVLALGAISCTAPALNYLLSTPKGGNIVVLVPGGAEEAFNSRPRQYRLLLNKRKGFVKLALKNGTPLVPVVSFGEPDLYDQVVGKRLRKVQEYLRGYFGFAPVILIGRGLFQYTFGILPQRKPITTVVGNPLNVERNASPTKEQIEELHHKFSNLVLELFEQHKHKYLKNADKVHMEID